MLKIVLRKSPQQKQGNKQWKTRQPVESIDSIPQPVVEVFFFFFFSWAISVEDR
jgi:hypothetical protein